MGDRISAAIHPVGLVPDQVHVTHVLLHRAVAGVAGEAVPLARDIDLEIDLVARRGLPRQQRAPVLVHDALAAGEFLDDGQAGVLVDHLDRVDVGRIRVGLVVAAEQAEAHPFARRARQHEVRARRVALVAAFGQVVVGRDLAREAVGALGDDVDHPTRGTRAIARRRRAADDLDAFDQFGGHPIGIAARVALAAPAHLDRVARQHGLAVDQDQRVFRPHPADVDLALVAALTCGRGPGQVDAGLLADDFRHVVDDGLPFKVLLGDLGHAKCLLGLLLCGQHHRFQHHAVGFLRGKGDRHRGRGQSKRRARGQPHRKSSHLSLHSPERRIGWQWRLAYAEDCSSLLI